MGNSVDRHPAFEANAHATQGATGFAGNRPAEESSSSVNDRRGHGGSRFDVDLPAIYGNFDQWSPKLRAGEYGSAGMAGSRPRMASAMSSAVPSEVVIPSPSWPAAA